MPYLSMYNYQAAIYQKLFFCVPILISYALKLQLLCAHPKSTQNDLKFWHIVPLI